MTAGSLPRREIPGTPYLIIDFAEQYWDRLLFYAGRQILYLKICLDF